MTINIITTKMNVVNILLSSYPLNWILKEEHPIFDRIAKIGLRLVG